jgi:hypothetical protein
MDRRTLIAAGLVSLGAAPALARAQDRAPERSYPEDRPTSDQPDSGGYRGDRARQDRAARETYSDDEIINAASDFFGLTAEAVGGAVERVFKENGRPTAYIAGAEGSGAIVVGLRYGKGLLYMKGEETSTVYWQGPSAGWDWGGNASRVFTLCYNLQYPDAIYRRFPGVEGAAYLIGGIGVNYQRADEMTLAPMRAGVGLRLGANVGYLSYSRSRHILPF